MDDTASNQRTLVYEEVVEVRPLQTGQVQVLDATPVRLTAKGIASLSPVASNSDDAGRAQNRRVELVQQ